MSEEKVIPEEIKMDKASFDALQKSYKGGYLDGMIAGLHAAGCENTVIAKYLDVDEKYVANEVHYFIRSCEDSEKMSDHIDPIKDEPSLEKIEIEDKFQN